VVYEAFFCLSKAGYPQTVKGCMSGKRAGLFYIIYVLLFVCAGYIFALVVLPGCETLTFASWRDTTEGKIKKMEPFERREGGGVSMEKVAGACFVGWEGGGGGG
jgi:hypothetical protein